MEDTSTMAMMIQDNQHDKQFVTTTATKGNPLQQHQVKELQQKSQEKEQQ
jgi:hypothetical protein